MDYGLFSYVSICIPVQVTFPSLALEVAVDAEEIGTNQVIALQMTSLVGTCAHPSQT